MIRKPLGIIIITLALSIAASAVGGETTLDGHYWRNCSSEEKLLFVHGVMSGVLLGQDRVVRYGQADRGAAAMTAECQRTVIGVVNALERQIDRWDRNQFLEAMDDFYNDPDHLDLNVRWAVMVVMLQLQGAAPEDVQDAVRQIPDAPP
jgi:hypothetical protein